MDGGGPMRPDGSRLQRDRSIGLGLLLVVVVALVVTVSAPPASAPPSQPPEAGASGRADRRAHSRRSRHAAWEPVDVSPDDPTADAAVATLEPTKAGTGGVAVDTDVPPHQP